MHESWLARRHRKAVAFWGRRFRVLPVAPHPTLGLFCDCEGHHAGPAAEAHADRGLDRLLELLDRLGLRITFNIVADLCRTHPKRVRRIMEAGHEVACHGWRHERPSDLSFVEINAMLDGAREAFASVDAGPVGFRSPESAWSVPLVRALARHGYQWNAERDRSWRPYRISRGLVRIPTATDDWDVVDGTGNVPTLLAKWRQALDRSVDGGVTCIGVHEWVFGLQPALEDALRDFLAEWLSQPAARVAPLGTIAGVALGRRKTFEST